MVEEVKGHLSMLKHDQIIVYIECYRELEASYLFALEG